MDRVNALLLLGGVLLLFGVLASTLSARLGLPFLLIFLVIGMLAGEDGPSGIRFDDFGASFFSAISRWRSSCSMAVCARASPPFASGSGRRPRSPPGVR